MSQPERWETLEDGKESAQSHDAAVLLNICAQWSAKYLAFVMPVHCMVIPKHGYPSAVWQNFPWGGTTHLPWRGTSCPD